VVVALSNNVESAVAMEVSREKKKEESYWQRGGGASRASEAPEMHVCED